MRTRIMIAAAALAALAVAGCGSSKTTTANSGTETFHGTTTSTANNPTVALKAAGLFADTGSITLGGGPGAGTGTLKLSKGDLKVEHSKGTQSQSVNKTTCQATFTETGTFKVLSGTGKYVDYTGHGTFKVTFQGTAPKKNSKCATNAQPKPGTSYTTFTATGLLTK